MRYICTICGYVYVPELGESNADIAPGTAFADLPADFCCPICGVSKESFCAT